MRMFMWLFLLLPLLELYVLIRVGSEIGALAVVLWIILSAIAGVFCIRLAGMATALSVRERVARGEVPDSAMLTGLLWVIGGVLLFIPGFISDVLGLVCIFPLTRYWLIKRMHRHVQPRGFQEQPRYTQERRENVTIIEGEFERHEPPKQ